MAHTWRTSAPLKRRRAATGIVVGAILASLSAVAGLAQSSAPGEKADAMAEAARIGAPMRAIADTSTS
jgi:hypothetical protein